MAVFSANSHYQINASYNGTLLGAILTVTSTTRPYGGLPVAVSASAPTRIEAENYDFGGEGIAYHDIANGADTAYRADNIGVEAGTVSNGYYVTWTAAGEWDTYTLRVASAGTYTLSAAIGSPTAGGTFHLEFGPLRQVGGTGVTKTAEFTVPNTGSYATYQTVSVPGVALPSGLLWMRLVIDSQYPCRFDDFTLTPAPVLTSIVVSPNPVTLSTGASQPFTAIANDQNGKPLSPQPPIAWTSTGVGMITAAGLYSAGTTAGTATVKATSGTVTGTAAVTVSASSSPTLSLTAAATGTNKVTLYWNGISGASGYNVYRSTVSGGPYTQIAQNVATADPGPGLTNAFMYSDSAGLTTGTEYFYVVRAVQSGSETVQSNEASDIPQAGAVPWDTGDPIQILSAETSQLNAVLPPDIDPDTGDFVPAQVGLLTVQGPNGVMYESADTEGDPITAYAAPGSFDSANNQLVLSDGETIPVPAPDTPPTGINNPNAVTPMLQPSALPQNFQQDFSHQFDPSLGIEREILSLPGYVGLSSTELIFPSPSTTPENIQLNTSGPKGELDSADVYTGGFINGVYNTELDAGLVLTSSNASKDPAWQPVTFNYFDHHQVVTPGRPKAVTVNGQTLTGFERVLLYGDASSPLQMKFVTGGASPSALQGQVALNYRGQYQKIIRNPADRSILSRGAKLTGWITLVAPQPQWKWRFRNSMIIKRVSSIAQNIPAKQPQQQNGSFMYGGAWGGDGSIDREGQLLKASQGYVDWDQTPTWLAGGYPFPGNGYLYFVPQIPYHWENHINLSTSYNSLLSIY